MIEPIDVYAVLEDSIDTEGMTKAELMPSCEKALAWVKRHLAVGAEDENELIGVAAGAMARYFLFLKNLGHPETYGMLKVGDMTVRRDLQKEFEIEKQLRDAALCQAASILKDGRFYFHAE